MERWSILMHKEYFKFSCAHFLIFPDGSKERLHGHNYQVSCEIHGELTDRGLVIDFKRAKPIVRAICDELDEHWLIPDEHPELLHRERDDGHTEVTYRDCHYLAPSEEVIVLPINNTSAENLATYIGRRVRAEIAERFGPNKIKRLHLGVSETSGQHGVYEFEVEDA
ncbi:MAG: 6-carboxytetrahydropterin synthase [Planctomycetota bacterium]|jgi:6-pyruvoyltetrahydropterin/6-carboxytetrahydropterin synthase|nr:6-carboxytetrahydropterin synthase [Planctomycetota bacterium]